MCTNVAYSEGVRHHHDGVLNMGDHKDGLVDEYTHDYFWQVINFEDPCTDAERGLFRLCGATCAHQDHQTVRRPTMHACTACMHSTAHGLCGATCARQDHQTVRRPTMHACTTCMHCTAHGLCGATCAHQDHQTVRRTTMHACTACMHSTAHGLCGATCAHQDHQTVRRPTMHACTTCMHCTAHGLCGATCAHQDHQTVRSPTIHAQHARTALHMNAVHVLSLQPFTLHVCLQAECRELKHCMLPMWHHPLNVLDDPTPYLPPGTSHGYISKDGCLFPCKCALHCWICNAAAELSLQSSWCCVLLLSLSRSRCLLHSRCRCLVILVWQSHQQPLRWLLMRQPSWP
jgi:hypothetical protein